MEKSTRIFPDCRSCHWCLSTPKGTLCNRSARRDAAGEMYGAPCREERRTRKKFSAAKGEPCGKSGRFFLPKTERRVIRERYFFSWGWFWLAFAIGAAAFWITYAVIRLEVSPSANPASAENSAIRRLSR